MPRLIAAVLMIGAACAPTNVVVLSPSPDAPTAIPSVARPVPTPAPIPTTPPRSPTGPPPTPAPTVRIVAPVSAGIVPGAGTLIVRSLTGALYRYDGPAGTIEPLTSLSAWSPLRETIDGVFELGLQGGVTFVPWHASPSTVPCGRGTSASVSLAGACASVGGGPDGGLFVRYPADAAARLILPADWQPYSVEWHPDSLRMAVTRLTPQAGYQIRTHDALWLLQGDGSLRQLYEPCCGAIAVSLMRWSPSGETLALLLTSGCAGCDGDGGNPLELIDPVTGRLTELGPTPGGSADFGWSSAGSIAFIRGTFNKRADAALILRAANGQERQLDIGGSAPAWDPTGERLAWARADGTATVLRLSTGERTILTCGSEAVVGLRFASRGDAILLLCRRTDPSLDIFDLFLGTGGQLNALVTDLGGGLRFVPPDIRQLVAWDNGAP